VFEDDIEINIFLELVDEFSALHIGQEHDSEDDPPLKNFLIKLLIIILFSCLETTFQRDWFL
jgi:hypothetical protein